MIYVNIVLIPILLILVSCATGPSVPDTPECRMAKSEYQIWYGNCLMETPGDFLQVAGICGNQCMEYTKYMARACR